MPVYDSAGNPQRPRMPVLGKIRLGEKRESARSGREHPVATPYFVLRDAPAVAQVFGPEPTALAPLIIPVEDEETVASHWYRAYTTTWGLTCKGDGRQARRLVDRDALERAGGVVDPPPPLAGPNTRRGTWITVPCPCPLLASGECGQVLYFRFVLPTVPGLGLWQIATRSPRSIRNVQGTLALVKAVAGGISDVPLRLSLVPEAVNRPDGGGRVTVHVLRLDLYHAWTPAQMMEAAATPGALALPAGPDPELRAEEGLEVTPEASGGPAAATEAPEQPDDTAERWEHWQALRQAAAQDLRLASRILKSLAAEAHVSLGARALDDETPPVQVPTSVLRGLRQAILNAFDGADLQAQVEAAAELAAYALGVQALQREGRA